MHLFHYPWSLFPKKNKLKIKTVSLTSVFRSSSGWRNHLYLWAIGFVVSTSFSGFRWYVSLLGWENFDVCWNLIAMIFNNWVCSCFPSENYLICEYWFNLVKERWLLTLVLKFNLRLSLWQRYNFGKRRTNLYVVKICYFCLLRIIWDGLSINSF